jgi:hypothetical protein
MTMFRLNGVPANVRALPILQSASGSIATFNTDLTDDLVSVKCQIVAKQASGTPTPDNPLPITTYTEMNVGIDKVAGFYNFNQLVNKTVYANLANLPNGTISNDTATGTVTISVTDTSGATNQASWYKSSSHPFANHVVFLSSKITSVKGCSYRMRAENAYMPFVTISANIPTILQKVVKVGSYTGTAALGGFMERDYLVAGDTITIEDFIVIDLTQMFGATIADYIYSLEQQTAGSGVAYVKNLLYKDYYAYNTGTIETLGTINNDGTGHTYNIPFGQTVANGVLDITTGKLEITHGVYNLTGSCIEANWYNADIDRNSIGFYIYPTQYVNNTGYPFPIESGGVFDYCQTGNVYNNDNAWTANFLFVSGAPNRFEIRLPKSVLSDISSGINALNSARDYLNNNPLQTMYKITPYSIQLDSITLQALLNENNIWCDTGDTEVKFWMSINKYIGQ